MKYRSPRRPTDIEIEVEHDNEILVCRVRDVSLHGARLEGDFNLAGPDRMTLYHNGRRIEARIVWMRFGVVGVAFEKPLEKSAFNAFVGIASHRSSSRENSRRYMVG